VRVLELFFGKSYDQVVVLNMIVLVLFLTHIVLLIMQLRNFKRIKFDAVIIGIPFLTLCISLLCAGFGFAITLDSMAHVTFPERNGAVISGLSVAAGSILFPMVFTCIETISTSITMLILHNRRSLHRDK